MLTENKKLLYLSCHSIAEHDEITLLNELGFDVYSHGSYVNPSKPADPIRPPLPQIKYHEWFEKEAHENPKDDMSADFLNKFDVIFSHWMPHWVMNNFDKAPDKLWILRTNGQSVSGNEIDIAGLMEKGVKVIRYSPAERRIPNYAGEDAMIRFYKDPNEWKGWDGSINRVINITQNIIDRGIYCGWDIFNDSTKGLPRKLFGRGNQAAGKLWGGQLTPEELHWAYQNNRCYFYTGTFPACYTLNFIEAFMTGIPIVAVGRELGNPTSIHPGQYSYEVDEIIEHGKSGFISDDIGELRRYVKNLLDDENRARSVSIEGRKRAIELFGKDKIKEEWSKYFESACRPPSF